MAADLATLSDQLVDWLYEQHGTDTSHGIEVEPFMAATGIDQVSAMNLVLDAAERGLVRDWSGLDAPCAVLTPAGIRVAQERQRARSDPVRRSAAARTGLLCWLYDQQLDNVKYAMTDGMLASDHAAFMGTRLTADDAARASQYLREKGLIRGAGGFGHGGLLRAELTAEGSECVEQHGGNVSDYLSQRDRAGTTFTIGTFNNTGSAAFGGDAIQHIAAGVDLATLGPFLQVLLQELPGLPLDAAGRAGSQEALQEAQKELASATPDRGRVLETLGRFAGYIGKAGQPAITAILLTLAKQYGMTP